MRKDAAQFTRICILLTLSIVLTPLPISAQDSQDITQYHELLLLTPDLPDTGRYPLDIAWNPDSSQIAVSSLDKTQIWDIATGEPVISMEASKQDGVAWSPDGTMLASIGHHPSPDDNLKGRFVLIWDATTGQLIHALTTSPGVPEWPRAVAWKPDGSQLAVRQTDVSIRLWNTATWQKHDIWVIEGVGEIRDIAWSPDGTMLVSANFPASASIIDSTTGQTITTLSVDPNSYGLVGSVASVIWSPTGDQVLGIHWVSV